MNNVLLTYVIGLAFLAPTLYLIHLVVKLTDKVNRILNRLDDPATLGVAQMTQEQFMEFVNRLSSALSSDEKGGDNE